MEDSASCDINALRSNTSNLVVYRVEYLRQHSKEGSKTISIYLSPLCATGFTTSPSALHPSPSAQRPAPNPKQTPFLHPTTPQFKPLSRLAPSIHRPSKDSYMHPPRHAIQPVARDTTINDHRAPAWNPRSIAPHDGTFAEASAPVARMTWCTNWSIAEFVHGTGDRRPGDGPIHVCMEADCIVADA